MSTTVLDRSQEHSISDVIVEALDTCGFSPEESIPGLILAIILVAEMTSSPESALDEAANLLADSGKEE